MLKVSIVLAFIAAVAMSGVKLALGETLWWPFAIVEFIGAALLIGGAVLAIVFRDGRLLAGAWGFTAASSYSTLFHHLEKLTCLSQTGPVEWGLTLLLASSTVGLILTAWPSRT